ncbi:hypothetical protein [Phyllobacterium chamaecytisi]|uniref:hypothetical protein n=1 Tax=Phyllobacterium chamaecytisi TaxID=2876082 RepID=UPI001CCB9E6D|nr:hypothetical protein [Phyllobacterium sp. KW56]MBZ9605039.1 hypothetical protein [Phyllobacterium sp. KW56]
MPSLFLKDEAVEKAPVIVGFEVIRYIRSSSEGRVSIFDLVDRFKREKWFTFNSLMYGLTFLYAVGLLDFEEPYLVALDAN